MDKLKVERNVSGGERGLRNHRCQWALSIPKSSNYSLEGAPVIGTRNEVALLRFSASVYAQLNSAFSVALMDVVELCCRV